MNKINVKTIIKNDYQWTIEQDHPGMSLKDMKEKYLNTFVTDGVDDLHVTQMKFTPTGITNGHYVVDLIDDEQQASQFLKI